MDAIWMPADLNAFPASVQLRGRHAVVPELCGQEQQTRPVTRVTYHVRIVTDMRGGRVRV